MDNNMFPFFISCTTVTPDSEIVVRKRTHKNSYLALTSTYGSIHPLLRAHGDWLTQTGSDSGSVEYRLSHGNRKYIT